MKIISKSKEYKTDVSFSLSSLYQRPTPNLHSLPSFSSLANSDVASVVMNIGQIQATTTVSRFLNHYFTNFPISYSVFQKSTALYSIILTN